MITRTHSKSSLSWPLHAFVIGFLSVVVLYGAPGETNQAQAQESASKKKDYADKEFAQQLKEVQKQFPLVAKALDFLERVPRFCNVDPVCFTRVQDVCLRSELPRRYCLERAQEACCMVPVLAPISN